MKLSILFIFTFLNLTIWAQSVLEFPQKPYSLDTNLIRDNNIRSLIVLAEFTENGIDKITDETLRTRLFEFDEDGYVVYEVEMHKKIYTSSYVGNKEEIMELTIISYNDDKQKVYECVENERWMIESFFEYDKKQNLSKSENMFDGETYENIEFKWKKGKMIKSKAIYMDEDEEITYNEDREIIEYTSYDDKYLYQYQKNGDTTTFIESQYHQDTLNYVKHFSYLGGSESQMTHFLTLNKLGDKETEVIVSFDEYRNTTDYHFQDFKKISLDGGEPKMRSPKIYEIKNEYDERGLLVKQVFYLKEGVDQKMIFDKVLHYKYEITPLDFKLEKGSIKKEHHKIELR